MAENVSDENQPARKRRPSVGRLLERHVANPVMRGLLLLGVAPRAYALLETTGRRTGRKRLTPVSGRLEDHRFWLVAEHCRRCDFVKNLLAHPQVRVKLGWRWRNGSATLVPGDDSWLRRQTLDRANGLIGRLDGWIFRLAATDPCTIRIDLTD